MKQTGAQLAVYALEQIGVTFTYGMPGVHNIEIYDELDKSTQITPILITHENSATFMADAFSRTTGKIGVAVIVPAAGLTNGMSGIGEAFLDGIPSLIISGGVRRDSGRHYQLHQIDQGRILDGLIKKYHLVTRHEDIIPVIYEAYKTAMSGEPGPVFVEIPAELQLFQGEVSSLPKFENSMAPSPASDETIKSICDALLQAKTPALYLGWGAINAFDETQKLSDILALPVATTLQGLSAFPADHPMHTGVGFGPSAVPAAQNAFKHCDCLLAVGLRFGELATGSYGLTVPENLIHIDINPEVFNKNYPARITLAADAKQALQMILKELDARKISKINSSSIADRIKSDKSNYVNTWLNKKQNDRVSPGYFFKELRKSLARDAFVVVDDGTHTFLTAELMPIYQARHFISPTDFNCMGYCIPSAIATKLAHPDKQVVAIVGDGAFLMTGLELLTASTHGLGIIVFVFHDGELGQISQFQKVPLNRKTCTVLGNINFKGIADATHCHYITLDNDASIEAVLSEAIAVSQTNQPVLVDVRIDYSQKTMLTKGVLKVNLSRFPLKEKMRFIARAVKRHVLG